MKETIYYVSDFTFFSAAKDNGKYNNVINALIEHIKYISRKADYTFNLDISKWTKLAQKEIEKRKNARIALKFLIALPKGLQSTSLKKLHTKIKAFLAWQLNIPSKNIAIAYVNKPNNPHAHILIFPRKQNGKKLRLTKHHLRCFHKNFKKFWEKLGYKINYSNKKLPHFGPIVKKIPNNIIKFPMLSLKINNTSKLKIHHILASSPLTFVHWVIQRNHKYQYLSLPTLRLPKLLDKLSNIKKLSAKVTAIWIVISKDLQELAILIKVTDQTKGGTQCQSQT